MLNNIKIISPQTLSEFEKYYYFRWYYLRKDLNKKKGTEKDELELESIHKMIIDDNNQILGVGRIHHVSKIESQIRFFAIHHNFRRKGLGFLLMNHLENIAKNNNSKTIILNARINAVDFYKDLNYEVIEKTNLLFGVIQHFKMKKVL